MQVYMVYSIKSKQYSQDTQQSVYYHNYSSTAVYFFLFFFALDAFCKVYSTTASPRLQLLLDCSRIQHYVLDCCATGCVNQSRFLSEGGSSGKNACIVHTTAVISYICM